MGEGREHANRCPLAETADYDAPRVDSGLDFCGDELTDAGYRAKHAGFVLASFKVESLDVKPANVNPIVQVLSDEPGYISRK